MKSPELSIVIGAYQEAARIQHSLRELAAYLREHNLQATEVVVVVADSPDGTAKLAAAEASLFKNFRVIDAGPKAGKGRDIRLGMMEARGAYRLYMDADLATPLHHIAQVMGHMAAGDEVIIGVRDLSSSHTGFRKLISAGGNFLIQLFVLRGITDTQCGFKAFSAKATQELFSRQTILGWGFDMELLVIARKLGYKVATIEIDDWHDQPHGTIEEAGFTLAAFETLWELVVIVWRRLMGGYTTPNYHHEARQ